MDMNANKPRWTKSEKEKLVDLATRRAAQNEPVDCRAVSTHLPGRSPAAVHAFLHRMKNAGRLPAGITISDPLQRPRRKPISTQHTDPQDACDQTNPADAAVDELCRVVYRLAEEAEANSKALAQAHLEIDRLKAEVGQAQTKESGYDSGDVDGAGMVALFQESVNGSRMPELEHVRMLLSCALRILRDKFTLGV